jgi:electron transfer flavoprotein alpha subunit
MRVAVLVKQVPDVAELHLDPVTRTLVREGVPAVMNMYDRTALSRALQLRDASGAEVVALSMGPPAAVDVLRECLAGGVDRAVLISDSALAGSDTWVTAKVIAAALRQMGAFDLVLCGQHSTDSETGQVGPEVAALLGLTQVTAAVALDVAGEGFDAVLEIDGGTETVRGRLPALVSVVEAMLKPRRIHPTAYRETSPGRVEVWDAASLHLDGGSIGLAGSPTVVRAVREDAPVRRCEILGGADAAGELVARLDAFGDIGDAEDESLAVAGPVRSQHGPCLLVAAESEDGVIHRGVAELIGEASRFADALGGWVAALALGGEADGDALAAAGADLVLVPQPACGRPGASWPAAALAAIELLEPLAVVAPASPRGRDWMPRVAATLRAGMVGDGIGLELNGGELLSLKPAFGGAVVAPIASRTTPLLTTIRPGTCLPLRADDSRDAPLRVMSVAVADSDAVTVLERRVDNDAAELAGARGVVVCAGFGTGGPDGVAHVRRFAAAIGAAFGGSRRVVDSGWLPRSRQIGISGHALVCRLYIGVAVRGAANHLAGLRRAGTVVAVNHDANAGIFNACDYGLVCDWREGVDALSHAFAERSREHPASE